MISMKKYLLALILMLSLSFAILISGDAGKQFAVDKAASLCGQANVSAVFICNGNVVRAVYSVSSAGSTFYKPDGEVINCPDVPAPQMGAECLQMMMPNYCPQQENCGASNATSYFPPNNLNQSVVTNQTGPSPVQNQTAGENQTVPQNQTAAENQTPSNTPGNGSATTQPEVPNEVKTGTENPLGYMLPVLVLLGIVALVVLFLLFKNSIQHD